MPEDGARAAGGGSVEPGASPRARGASAAGAEGVPGPAQGSPAGAGASGREARPTGVGARDREVRTPPPEADAQIYLHPQTLARLGTLDLRAKMIVEGVMAGAHRSPYHGFSVEFAQHRPYSPGDDIRHLDWKVFGRTDKLHLKQYQQETNLDLMIMVDASGSMNYGSRSFAEASGTGRRTSLDQRSVWTKYDHATALAAAFSYMALRQGDRVGLVVFADEILAASRRTSAMSAWRQIVGTLATQTVGRPTALSRVIDQAMGKLNNRALIAIVSDFLVDLEEIRTALARLRHRRHDLILCQVLDHAELTFNLDAPVPLEGLEGEPRLRIDPRALRKAYLESLQAHLDGVQRLARSFGFDYILVDTHDWLGPPMAAFMARRNSRMKKRSG